MSRTSATPRIGGVKVLGALATLFFVIVFNFFLFRVVESDPVGTLVRGRSSAEGQQARRFARGADARHAEARRLLGQMVDLLVEDQRQAGEAQHQQERRADEARPFLHQIPDPDRLAGHGSSETTY